jgi:hypothetical protein
MTASTVAPVRPACRTAQRSASREGSEPSTPTTMRDCVPCGPDMSAPLILIVISRVRASPKLAPRAGA